MFPRIDQISLYLRPGTTDLRKGINGLIALIEDEMDLDALSGSLFLFCNSQRKLLKALYWDTTGFCLWQKRLESSYRFPWPRGEQEAHQIKAEELKMMLSGIDCWGVHEPLYYDSVM